MQWSERPPAARSPFPWLGHRHFEPGALSVAVAHFILVRAMSRPSVIVASILFTVLPTVPASPPEYLAKRDNIQPGKYGALLRQYLLITPADFGRMVLMPSFKTETAVSVYSVPKSGASKDTSIFRITVTFANESLWEIAEGSSSAKDPRVSRHDLDIDAALALAIQQAWRAVLAKDPIPTESSDIAPDITLDGTISVFSVVMPDGKTVIREAANPLGAPASELVGAGIDLWGYATAPEEERKTRREKLMRTLHRLAETHGKP